MFFYRVNQKLIVTNVTDNYVGMFVFTILLGYNSFILELHLIFIVRFSE